MFKFATALAGALTLAGAPLHAQEADAAPGTSEVVLDAGRWVTLGTVAGPIASPTRSQPANLLIAGGQNLSLIHISEPTRPY